jgi:hypothetical protein
MINNKVSELIFFIFLTCDNVPNACEISMKFCDFYTHLKILWAKNVFSRTFAGFEARRAQNAKKRKIFLKRESQQSFAAISRYVPL